MRIRSEEDVGCTERVGAQTAAAATEIGVNCFQKTKDRAHICLVTTCLDVHATEFMHTTPPRTPMLMAVLFTTAMT